MEPADAFDVESLLVWKTSWDEVHGESREVIGVREFYVAKALLEGHKESLGVLVESNRRQTHIFDLCLEFGHTDTALALASHGVESCIFESWHLGPHAEVQRPWGKHLCQCIDQSERCNFCTFGWDIDHGTWMKDWNAPLPDAARAAHKAVERNPFLREIMSCHDMVVETCFSADAMARLLDIAILTGHKEAAVDLSSRCQVRPLRRWCADEIFGDLDDSWRHNLPDDDIEVVLAALAAGADFHRMRVMSHWLSEISGDDEVPFQAAIFVLEENRWHEIVRLCPPPSERSGLRRLRRLNGLGAQFLEYDHSSVATKLFQRLSRDKVQAAGNVGIHLRDVHVRIAFRGGRAFLSTLLGMAILSGEPDCAVEFLRLGVTETGWEGREDVNDEFKRHLRDENNSVQEIHVFSGFSESPASACRSAAKAAVMADLRASWNQEAAEKGVPIIQLFKKMLGPKKSFPVAIVNDILCFSMKTPKFVEQLDLWDLVDGWMTSAAGVQDEPEVREEPGESCDPRQTSDQPGTSSGAVAHADAAIEEADVGEEKMGTAEAGRGEVPALNSHGVYVFRLTRMATSSHISDLLLDAEGPLAPLHFRMLAAGCEVNPDWSPVKALFVPMTKAQMEELQALARQGYRLNKNDHILALQEDHEIIERALKKSLPKKNRLKAPKLKKVGPQAMDAEEHEDGADEADTDPLLVMEGGFSTDSDLGFGEYQL